MAEVEFGGLKFTGGKMFALITALSTLGGAAWGGFEFYNDYRNMKAQIESYVSPDLSGFDQRLAVFSETIDGVEKEFINLKEIDAATEDTIRTKVDSIKDMIDDVKSDVRNFEVRLENSLDRFSGKTDQTVTRLENEMVDQEARNRQNIVDVRGVINAFETRLDAKISKLDEKIESLEKELDYKIAEALNNPLSGK